MDVKKEGAGAKKTKGKKGRGGDREGEEIDSHYNQSGLSRGVQGKQQQWRVSINQLFPHPRPPPAGCYFINAFKYSECSSSAHCVAAFASIPCSTKYNHRAMPDFLLA